MRLVFGVYCIFVLKKLRKSLEEAIAFFANLQGLKLNQLYAQEETFFFIFPKIQLTYLN
jgi:hypothetical protein